MHRIAEQIYGMTFDWYVAISRGGLVPAALLSQITGQRNIDTFCISRYDTNGKPCEAKIINKNCNHLYRKDILLIDDLLDHGETAKLAMEYLKTWRGASVKSIKLAVIYWKPHSIVIPDFYIEKCESDKWINFDWELEQNIED